MELYLPNCIRTAPESGVQQLPSFPSSSRQSIQTLALTANCFPCCWLYPSYFLIHSVIHVASIFTCVHTTLTSSSGKLPLPQPWSNSTSFEPEQFRNEVVWASGTSTIGIDNGLLIRCFQEQDNGMKVRSRGSTALAMSAVGSVTVELETPQREGAGCESASFSGCQGSLGYEDGVGMLTMFVSIHTVSKSMDWWLGTP